MRPRLVVVGITVATLLLSACGESAVDENGGGDPTGAHLETVNVGLVPTVNVASLFLGMKKGFFREEGIEVVPHQADSGGAILSGLIHGSHDFAFASPVPGLVAASKGAPLKMVVGAGVIVGNGHEGPTSVVVDSDSDIDSYADLAGKTVSVNSLRAHFDLCLRVALDSAQVDPVNVRVIELPFNQVEPSIERGQIDAGVLIDPFKSAAVKSGLKSIGDPCSAGLPANAPSSIYLASEQTVKDRPELVERFVRALTKSQEYSNEHHDEVRDVLPEYTKIEPEIARSITIEKLRSEVDRQSYNQLVELMVEHKFIASPDSVARFAPTRR